MKWWKLETDHCRNDRVYDLLEKHGIGGYGFYIFLMNYLYELDETGYQAEASDRWIRKIARECFLSDSHIVVRYLDTLAIVGLINPQLWAEKIVGSDGITERADAFMQSRLRERDKKRRQRQNGETSSLSLGTNEMSLGIPQMSPNVPPPDPDPDPDPDTERDPITHADPYCADAKKSADAERVCEEGCFEKVSVLEPEPEPEPEQAEPLASTEPTPDLLEKHGISRVGEFSGGVVSQSTQNFNDRFNHSSDIAPVTDELIRLYNNGKPNNWAGIVGDSRRARRKIQDMALKYQGTGGKLAELPEMMKKALLWYGGSDFHTKKEFGNGDIFWLCEQERVEIAAAKWAGSGESTKSKVATAILERENGIKHWEDGHVMRETELHCAKRAIPKMRFDYPGLPPLEWVRKNMPDILKKLSSDYPEYPQKEELNYACN